MIEWIVLVWTVACPWVPSSFRGIQDCPDGNVQRFFISSTTAQFEQKWNSLLGKERETARVFKGKEYQVRPFFELQSKDLDYEKALDEAEKRTEEQLRGFLEITGTASAKYTDRKFCRMKLHHPLEPISKWVSGEASDCSICGKRIIRKKGENLWEATE